MSVLFLLLLIAAAVCFLLSAIGTSVGRVNTLALGLFFWVLVPTIQALQAL